MKTILLCTAIVLSMFQTSFAQSCEDLLLIPEALATLVKTSAKCVVCEDVVGTLATALGETPNPAFKKETDKVVAECTKYETAVDKEFEKNKAAYLKEATTAKTKCDACAEDMATVLAGYAGIEDALTTCIGACAAEGVSTAATAAADAITAATTAVDAYKCESIAMPYTKEFEKFLTDEAKRQLKKVQTAVKALTDTLKKQVAADKKKVADCVKKTFAEPMKALKAFKCPKVA